MNRDEMKQMARLLVNSFVDLKRTIKTQEDMTDLVDAWMFWLAEYDSGAVAMAVKAFGTTKGSAFAPTPSEIIAMMHKPQELAQMTEGEAWALVRKAIGKSTYYSDEEFAKLPPECQRAVGSSNQLYSWATDTEFNESVVMSNFQRSFRNVIERKNEYEMLPAEMKKQVDKLGSANVMRLEDGKNNNKND